VSITLQNPSVLDVIGSTLKIAHPDISSYTRTYLANTIAAAATAMTVTDNDNFVDNDYFIVGEVGDEKTEEDDVNGVVTRGTALTVTNTLKFAHELDAPVTRIFERQIKIYGSATAVSSGGTLIATIDITWGKLFTEYAVTGTQYAYYYCTFYDGTTEGATGDYIAAGGAAAKSVWKLADQALEMTGAKIGPKDQIGIAYLVKAADECQREIQQYVEADGIKKDWGFESVFDEGIEVKVGENRYATSGLTNTPKYSDTAQAILDIYIGRKGPVRYVAIDQFDKLMQNKKRTQLNGASSVGGTSITVDDTSEFSTTGSLTHGTNTLTYTGKTDTTFTGIPASSTGSITVIGPDNLAIWQGVTNGLPGFYTIYDGNILFDLPISSTYDDYRLRVRMLKQLTALTAVSDETEVTFHNVFPYYIAYKIELRRKNFDAAQSFKNEWELRMARNARSEKSETLEVYQYHDFQNGDVLKADKWLNYPGVST
jgi:hypothetical protein